MTWLRVTAMGVLAVVFLAGLFAGTLAPAPYAKQFREEPDAAPSSLHWLGTDDLGRDRFSRVLYGTRISILLAPAARLSGGDFGGRCLVACRLPRWMDRARADGRRRFGPLPSVALLASRSPRMMPLNVAPIESVMITFLILGCLGWAAGARVVCAGASSLRHSDFALQARAQGCSEARLLWRHSLRICVRCCWHNSGFPYRVFILAEANLGDPRPWGLRASTVLGEPPTRVGRPDRAFRQAMGVCPFALADTVGNFLSGSAYGPGDAIMIARRRTLACAVTFALTVSAAAQGGGQLRFCLHSDPKTFDPVLVEDDASERVRYITGGFLIRVNRLTQDLEPELATSWKLSKDGRTISFQTPRRIALLRRHALFRRGRGLHDATAHGSCGPFAHRGRLPLG